MDLPNEIADDEDLYRSIPDKPNMKKYHNGEFIRFTSAAFKDSNGLSVDRSYYRDESEIIERINDRFGERSLVKLSAKDCRKEGAEPIPDPINENTYHSLIIPSQADANDRSTHRLKGSLPKKLQRISSIVQNCETNR